MFAKKKKYNTIKYVLEISNDLNTKIIIKHLRNIEQDKQKNINMIIRNERNNRRSQINKKFKRNMSKMQYYVCDEMNHINRNCFEKRNKLKNKNTNNKIEDLKNFERTRELKSRLKNSKSFKEKRRKQINRIADADDQKDYNKDVNDAFRNNEKNET